MNNELYHFGVKGMKWGVRRSRNSDTSKKRRNAKPALSKEDKRYDKLARKDAKEYARAKMFYGESAGNRRKLIKNTVNQRRKDNAHYNKVFDKYLAEQNMDKHVSAAKRERKVKNAANFGHRVAKKAFNAATSTPYILMSDNTGNELYHFGVKGMKWGVRHDREKTGFKQSSRDQRKKEKRIAKNKKVISREVRFQERAIRNHEMTAKQSKLQAESARKTGEGLFISMGYKPEAAKKNAIALSKRYETEAMWESHLAEQKREYISRIKKIDVSNKTPRQVWASIKEEGRITVYKTNDAWKEPYTTEEKAFVHSDFNNDAELYHFGVRGMKWGHRRYQNADGSYTAQGRGRYAPNGSSRKSSSGSRSSSSSTDRRARLKKAAKIGAGVAAAGLLAYGGYRLAKSGKVSGLKALPNKRLALPGPKTSKVRSAASRAKSVARGAASKVGNSGVGRRVKRGVNSAQYHATRIKNEMAYRRSTRGGNNVRSNVIGIGGPTYSKAGLAGYRVRRAASAVGSGARRAASGAKRAAGSPIRAHQKFTKWAFTPTGSKRRNFTRGLVYGGAHGLAFDAAVVGAAVHQGRKANKRYKNANSNKKRR